MSDDKSSGDSFHAQTESGDIQQAHEIVNGDKAESIDKSKHSTVNTGDVAGDVHGGAIVEVGELAAIANAESAIANLFHVMCLHSEHPEFSESPKIGHPSQASIAPPVVADAMKELAADPDRKPTSFNAEQHPAELAAEFQMLAGKSEAEIATLTDAEQEDYAQRLEATASRLAQFAKPAFFRCCDLAVDAIAAIADPRFPYTIAMGVFEGVVKNFGSSQSNESGLTKPD